MAVVDVLNKKGEKVSELTLNDGVFGVEPSPGVLHQVVCAQLANRRSGTASVKNRSDVAYSTKKLYRQKGTGRARRGSRKSPLLRGGGVVFGPHPKTYKVKVPKKVKKLALRMALSSKLAEQKLTVVDSLDMERIKTKDLAQVLAALKVKKGLVVLPAADEKVELSARNIPGIKVMRTEGVNVYDVLKYDSLVLLQPAVSAIEGRLAP
ncbi:MAG: 50S ribosomal protein L4 [Deltaproteobacteria bacterium]|nr:50S ribosomal protein L4 [Deltaproteobacteria bacterium]